MTTYFTAKLPRFIQRIRSQTGCNSHFTGRCSHAQANALRWTGCRPDATSLLISFPAIVSPGQAADSPPLSVAFLIDKLRNNQCASQRSLDRSVALAPNDPFSYTGRFALDCITIQPPPPPPPRHPPPPPPPFPPPPPPPPPPHLLLAFGKAATPWPLCWACPLSLLSAIRDIHSRGTVHI